MQFVDLGRLVGVNPENTEPPGDDETQSWLDPRRAGGSRQDGAHANPSAIGGRYRLMSDSTSGGMGTVFEALDTLLDRRVAIKFLHADSRGEARAVVLREARAMAGLRHRSICRVLEVEIDPPPSGDRAGWRPFIVMEWIHGEPIAAYWRHLAFEQRLALFEQVADAVARMHLAGILHRDLKPANIMVDTEGVPVVVDFGLSTRTGDGGARGGTPGWSAPEQFESGSLIGPQADVFALGVLFYVLLTDRCPFEAPSTAETIKRCKEGDAPLPETIVDDISASLQRIALAALDPDPAQRYADAREMLADIRRFKAGETVAAKPRRLYTRFEDEVERHLADADRWQRQGLATEEDLHPIRQGLLELQRPASPWILDSRRLLASQVTMYVGGWIVLLAMTIGVWHATRLWSKIAGVESWVAPALIASSVAAAGFLLAWIGEQRAALVFLFTSAVAVPTALWQFLRTTGHLSDKGPGLEFFPLRQFGLSSAQMLCIAALGMVVSLLYRLRTPSTAFTLSAVIYLMVGWFALCMRTIDPQVQERVAIGSLAGALLLPAAGMCAVGVVLDNRVSRRSGGLRSVTPTRDGTPLLLTGLLVFIVGSAILARTVPEWYSLAAPRLREDGAVASQPDVVDSCRAFLINGLVLLGASFGLGRHPTPLRDWCARALRWLIPVSFLVPLTILEIERAEPAREFWLASIGATSVILVVASAALQWRPFLLSGLLGLLDFVALCFVRLDDHFAAGSAAKLVLMLALVLLGLATMVAGAYPERLARSIAFAWRRSRAHALRFGSFLERKQ